MSEQQLCPRRNERPAIPGYPDFDVWKTDRWNADVDAQRKANAAEAEKYNAKHGPGIMTIGEDQSCWHWSWGPPRSCSYCGGIHPDDAIRLVEEGWEVEPTGKFYKRYLNPPGTSQMHQALMKNIGLDNSNVPSVWSPGPPVKLYTMHMDAAQVEKFNAAIKAQGNAT